MHQEGVWATEVVTLGLWTQMAEPFPGIMSNPKSLCASCVGAKEKSVCDISQAVNATLNVSAKTLQKTLNSLYSVNMDTFSGVGYQPLCAQDVEICW